MKFRTVLICLIALLVLTLNVQAATPVTWDPRGIEQTIGLGGEVDVPATFVSTVTLNDVDLRIVPELQAFISLNQTHFDVVEADTPCQVTLQFFIPFGSETGLYDGTIHVRVGSETHPQTLKIELNVVDAAATIGPEGGVIEVTDPESPICGTKVTFPAESLNQDTQFSVRYDALYDSDNFMARPIIVDHGDIQLQEGVILTLPLREMLTEDTTLLVTTFDEELNNYVPEGTVHYALAGDTLAEFQLSHLSRFSMINPRVLLSYGISTCAWLGQRHTACFPINTNFLPGADKWICQKQLVTDSRALDCMGRCGKGCPGDGFPECGGEFRYTLACFYHDACHRYLSETGNIDPISALLCEGLLVEALGECWLSPICENARDVCGDGIDNNDNGEVDEGCDCHKFDTDCDGCIDTQELMVAIDKWKAGEVSITELMEAIEIWKECTSDESAPAISFTSSIGGSLAQTTMGWEFTVGATPINVTALGFVDCTQFTPGISCPPITSNHVVAIWDADGTVLTSATVTPISPLTGIFRYMPISPIALDAGATYIIGAENDAGDIFFAQVFNFSTQSEITYVVERRDIPFRLGLNFPTYIVTNPIPGIFGPNFKFEPIP